MEKELFNDMIQSLNEAVSAASGDTSKGRSKIISVPDDTIDLDSIIFQQLVTLSYENKVKVIKFANELMQSSL